MRGYLDRNILKPEYARRSRQIYDAIKDGGGKKLEYYVNVPTSASGLTLIGPSGMGKSTNLLNILSLYPQVILHPEHNSYQIVWLKIDCPHAGSLKGLCTDIFLAIDRLFGTNHFKKFGSSRNSEDYMLAQVAQMAHTHHLGVLVIDEMQNLVNARRGTGEGSVIWDRMDNGGEWDLFMEGMWEYQWTKTPVALDDEINEAFYDESQGIIDIAIKLYKMVQ